MAYSQKEKDKIFNKVCERIAQGEALRNILDDKDVFSDTVWFELVKDGDKNKQYARANEIRQDRIFDEILTISDNQENDVIVKDGNKIINHNVINRNKLQIDSRKWILSKMDPKKYGDKQEVDIKANSVIQYKNVSKQFPDKE